MRWQKRCLLQLLAGARHHVVEHVERDEPLALSVLDSLYETAAGIELDQRQPACQSRIAGVRVNTNREQTGAAAMMRTHRRMEQPRELLRRGNERALVVEDAIAGIPRVVRFVCCKPRRARLLVIRHVLHLAAEVITQLRRSSEVELYLGQNRCLIGTVGDVCDGALHGHARIVRHGSSFTRYAPSEESNADRTFPAVQQK